VTSIGEYAFNGCSSLTTLIIGNGIKKIYDQAFADCPELTDVFCFAEHVPMYYNYVDSYIVGEDLLFEDDDLKYATLHVPIASVEAYKKDFEWKYFGTIVALTNEETGIKNIAADSSNSLFFTLDGKRTDMLQKGINIIKNSDGTSKKVFVK
jgi:hypothetical protein